MNPTNLQKTFVIAKNKRRRYSIYQNQGTPHLVLPGLACFFLSFFVIFNTLISFNEYKYPLHTLHFHTIPQGHWANQIQPVMLIVISMYVSGLYWAIQDKRKRHRARQGVALRQPHKTRRVSPGLEEVLQVINWWIWHGCYIQLQSSILTIIHQTYNITIMHWTTRVSRSWN